MADLPRPLDGVRVIDLSTYVAGPSCGSALAQLGAEVIRVDPIGGASDTRRLPLAPDGRSLYWMGLNRPKASVEIDTDSPDGRALVQRLVASGGADGGIVVTNAVGQPWLAYDELRRCRDDVILVHILGSADGHPHVDYTVNSETGLPWMTGPGDVDRPVNHVLPAWDLLTGTYAALAVVSALRSRTLHGLGQLVTVPLADVAIAAMCQLGFVADVLVNGTGRTRAGNYLYGSFGTDFPTSDGHRIMVVALTHRHWTKLVDATGASSAISALEHGLACDFSDESERYRYREVIEALMRPWFQARPLAEVGAAMDAARILWGPYRTVDDFVHDRNSMLNTSDITSMVQQDGIGPIVVARTPAVFTRSAVQDEPPTPRLGEHTDAVLAAVAQVSVAELRDLRSRGVIGG